jgi:hypothetical protein
VTAISFANVLDCVEILFCAIAFCALMKRKQWADYWALGSFLAVRIVSSAMLFLLLKVAGKQVELHVAYKAYFYVYWLSFACESILMLVVVHSIFRLAMAPLKGLQTLGMLVFRWAAAISVAVALTSAFAPHLSSSKYIVAAVSQLQRTQSILTLSLLLFVCFAIRPMGLAYSSRIFGVSLGLGITATANLVQSAWFEQGSLMYTESNLLKGIAICVSLAIWTGYFILPEPKRRMIVLPTTSPFLRWNQISIALGDSPGYVAVGGVPPELFAPAEIEIMRRASRKMTTPFPKSLRA